jgi:hypothetical protein
MNRFLFRLRLAIWAARHPDTLTMLHFEMLRDADKSQTADLRMRSGRYADRLTDAHMPGSQENIAAL